MAEKRCRGRPPHDDQLTPGEWRVVEVVRHGLTNPSIAAHLGVSVDAVKYHVANALAKLGFASRADLRLWPGVARTSLRQLPRGEDSMKNELKIGPIGQVARTVSDIAAATRWYGDTLGLRHLYSFGNLAFFDCDGTRLFLSEGESDAAESIIYFTVTDIGAAQTMLESAGAEFTHGAHMIHRHDDGTEEWMAFFADNEGRPLGLMERLAPKS